MKKLNELTQDEVRELIIIKNKYPIIKELYKILYNCLVSISEAEEEHWQQGFWIFKKDFYFCYVEDTIDKARNCKFKYIEYYLKLNNEIELSTGHLNEEELFELYKNKERCSSALSKIREMYECINNIANESNCYFPIGFFDSVYNRCESSRTKHVALKCLKALKKMI